MLFSTSRPWLFWASILLAGSTFAGGCGDEESADSGPRGSGAKAGSGGGDASAGAGGVSASGGSGGASGSDGGPTCTDVCTGGASECFGNATRLCAQQGTGCTDWNAPQSCASGETCSAGRCATGCSNVCTLGSRQCAGIQFQDCVTQDGGCNDWGELQNCPTGQTCNAGECRTTCMNNCTAGATQCSGARVQSCALQANGCTDWNPATNCPANQACVANACTPSCVDQCTLGATMCAGSQVQVCAQQGTGCTNWNAPANCPAGQTCQGTQCASGSGGSGGTAGSGGSSGSGATGGSGGTGGTTGGELAACRGVIAVRSGSGNYVGWRLKATDPANIAFNVYRGGTLVTPQPVTNSTNFLDANASAGSSYQIRPVVNGAEQGSSETTTAHPNPYISIPLDNGSTQAGRLAGVGDLDGDCEYDFVVKRGNADIDVTQDAPGDETFKLEAYKRDGTFLWRRDMGPNIEPGVWFSPFIVYDMDGDGRAEIVMKASEVPTNLGGDGDLNGDGITNYRNTTTGDVPLHSANPSIEFLEIRDGRTGALRARGPWIPIGPWGGDQNRYGRQMMAPAYLDGPSTNLPSVLITRGGNSRIEIHAYDFRNNQLTRRWVWFRSNSNGAYGHNVRVGDIDNDGKDELLFFSIAIDDNGGSNGSVLWDTGQAHGDRVHLSDIDPARPGQEVFYIQEFADVYTNPISLRDARTGALIWGPTANWGDVGRGLAADFDGAHPGMEMFASTGEFYSATGTVIGPRPNVNPNMAIWWDADLLREHITQNRIDKWNGSGLTRLLTATGCASGSREIPMGYADILGDWREEAWWVCNNNTELRVYVSTAVASNRMYTLMQEPQYRTSVGCMTMGYVQASQPSFFVGQGMSPSPQPRIAIPPGR
jgi:rhamnogalacturonan endolyase